MTEYLVDTSVFLRWFVKQIGWEHAREIRGRFLEGDISLETVDSVRFELAHVLRTKGLIKGLFDVETYGTAVRMVDDLGIRVHITDADALERSASLAAAHNLRFFDALIVARALDRAMPLLTADVKLCRAVEGLLSTDLLRGLDA